MAPFSSKVGGDVPFMNQYWQFLNLFIQAQTMTLKISAKINVWEQSFCLTVRL